MSFADLARIVTIRPLSSWPGPRTPLDDRQTSRFTAGWSDTVQLLVRELRHLDADNVILEIDIREQDLRLDGLPRANARLGDDAVILSFESKHGPLRYACDTFERPRWGDGRHLDGWQHNLRAIALGLDALRAVDRYGVTSRGEQYAGWKALPAPIAMDGPTHMTRDEAMAVLRRWARRNEAEVSDLSRLIRLAKINAHPDRHGNDHGPWNEVAAAEKVVGR